MVTECAKSGHRVGKAGAAGSGQRAGGHIVRLQYQTSKAATGWVLACGNGMLTFCARPPADDSHRRNAITAGRGLTGGCRT